MNWRNIIVSVCLLLLVIVAVVMALPDHEVSLLPQKEACTDAEASQVKPEQGYCAPNFTLPNTAGEEIELYQNEGKPTLINFWATWCSPCKVEMPYFESAYQKYGDQVNFLMVNQAGTELDEKNVTKYMEQHQFTFPVLMDRRETNIGFGEYKLIGIPVTFLMDSEGKIVFKRVGSMNEQELYELLEEII